MTPEAQDYLTKAYDDLADARKIQGIGLGEAAARGAHYAAFHAAEALLIEWNGKGREDAFRCAYRARTSLETAIRPRA